MPDRKPQMCPDCGHPRTSHSTQGCLHSGRCEYGYTKTYNDLTRKK